MTAGEINAMLQSIKNIQLKLGQATGIAVVVEIQMRLIGELCEPIRRKVNNDYLGCRLEDLENAIIAVFSDNLEEDERGKIKCFRIARNKLIHVEFVTLMNNMGIEPTGRQINSKTGNKNTLIKTDIKEAILSMDRNQTFEKFYQQATEVVSILDNLIFSLANK